MRMQKKQNTTKSVGYYAMFLPILCALAYAVFHAGGLSGAALLSAGLAMPQGAAQLARQYLESTVLSTLPEQTTLPVTQNKTTLLATQPTKSNNAVPPKTSSTQKTVDLTVTPPDIKALMAQALSKEKQGEFEKKGKLVAMDYGKSGTTDIYKNVRVKNVTDTKTINVQKELEKAPKLSIKDKSKPAVLLFHTHTTESYQLLDRDYYTQKDAARSDDPAQNVIRVGDEIEKQLEQAGYQVIHDRRIHDQSYSGAYDRTRGVVKEYLKQYPEIAVVLDVHRDAMHQNNGNKIKPVATINGKQAAQIMLISGAEEGAITDFPDWELNLRFALQLQQAMETLYPGLTRPILFSQRLYTMNLHPCNVLVEMGSDGNTLEEAVYSARLIGNALIEVLRKYTK